MYINNRLDQILGKQGSKSKDAYASKVSLASRVVKVERQVADIEEKIDLLLKVYMEDRQRLNPGCSTFQIPTPPAPPAPQDPLPSLVMHPPTQTPLHAPLQSPPSPPSTFTSTSSTVTGTQVPKHSYRHLSGGPHITIEPEAGLIRDWQEYELETELQANVTECDVTLHPQRPYQGTTTTLDDSQVTYRNQILETR